MIADTLKELGLDGYSLNARLKPTLLALLPWFLLGPIWIEELRSWGGTLIALVITCGVGFLLSQVARQSGIALEEKWGDAIGRAHSVRLLSHADLTINAGLKAQLIALVRQYGPGFPSESEETQDPEGSAGRRLAALNWLLEITRPDADQSLLLGENVAYGFWRNLRGLKLLALLLLGAALLLNAFLLYRTVPQDPRYVLGAAYCGFAIAMMLVWVLLVRRSRVEAASLTYAQRLFAQANNPALLARLKTGSGPATH